MIEISPSIELVQEVEDFLVRQDKGYCKRANKIYIIEEGFSEDKKLMSLLMNFYRSVSFDKELKWEAIEGK